MSEPGWLLLFPFATAPAQLVTKAFHGNLQLCTVGTSSSYIGCSGKQARIAPFVSESSASFSSILIGYGYAIIHGNN